MKFSEELKKLNTIKEESFVPKRGGIIKNESLKRNKINEYFKIDRNFVQSIKDRYPIGTRIELINMNDPFSPIESGTKGTVVYVDDIGQIGMKWDNGRSLSLIPGEDNFKKIKNESISEKALNNNLEEQSKKESYLAEVDYDGNSYEVGTFPDKRSALVAAKASIEKDHKETNYYNIKVTAILDVIEDDYINYKVRVKAKDDIDFYDSEENGDYIEIHLWKK